jgi:uncharacterized protein YneF (UPF0154 family)
MLWWQYLIVSVVLLVVGGLFGYWLNRRGMKTERDARERRELRDAVKGLLTEMNANLKLTEIGPEPALLPPLAKDMWNIHKSKILELPLEIQESLYQAYSSIDNVNAVLETRFACGNRGHGPGAWDTRYEREGKKAREPMEKARNYLEIWLSQQRQK